MFCLIFTCFIFQFSTDLFCTDSLSLEALDTILKETSPHHISEEEQRDLDDFWREIENETPLTTPQNSYFFSDPTATVPELETQLSVSEEMIPSYFWPPTSTEHHEDFTASFETSHSLSEGALINYWQFAPPESTHPAEINTITPSPAAAAEISHECVFKILLSFNRFCEHFVLGVSKSYDFAEEFCLVTQHLTTLHPEYAHLVTNWEELLEVLLYTPELSSSSSIIQNVKELMKEHKTCAESTLPSLPQKRTSPSDPPPAQALKTSAQSKPHRTFKPAPAKSKTQSTFDIIHCVESIYQKMLNAKVNFAVEFEFIKENLENIFSHKFTQQNWKELAKNVSFELNYSEIRLLLTILPEHIDLYLKHVGKEEIQAECVPAINLILRSHQKKSCTKSALQSITQAMWSCSSHKINISQLFHITLYLFEALENVSITQSKHALLKAIDSITQSLSNLLFNNVLTPMFLDIRTVLAHIQTGQYAQFNSQEKILSKIPHLFLTKAPFYYFSSPIYTKFPNVISLPLTTEIANFSSKPLHERAQKAQNQEQESSHKDKFKHCLSLSKHTQDITKCISRRGFTKVLASLIKDATLEIQDKNISMLMLSHPEPITAIKTQNIWLLLQSKLSGSSIETKAFLSLVGRTIYHSNNHPSAHLSRLISAMLLTENAKSFKQYALQFLTQIRQVCHNEITRSSAHKDCQDILEHISLDPTLAEYTHNPLPANFLKQHFGHMSEQDFASILDHTTPQIYKSSINVPDHFLCLNPDNQSSEFFQHLLSTNLRIDNPETFLKIENLFLQDYCKKNLALAMNLEYFTPLNSLARAYLKPFISNKTLAVFIIDFTGLHEHKEVQSSYPEIHSLMAKFLRKISVFNCDRLELFDVFLQLQNHFLFLLQKNILPHNCTLSLCRSSLQSQAAAISTQSRCTLHN